MDKNAIKKYAVWARRELISRVSQRAAMYDITADGYGDVNATAVNGRILSDEERQQRIALINQIKEKRYFDSLGSYSGNLLLVGINYDEKTKLHECKIEKLEV